MSRSRKKSIKTAKQKILTKLPWFDLTVEIYRRAVAFLANVVKKEWKNVSSVSGKEQVNLVERLTHQSKKSPNPPYDFDSRFYKFPSYLRRRAIQEAIGYVSSYVAQVQRWENKKGKKGKKPQWNPEPKVYPAFYKDNMWEYLQNGLAKLKLWNGKEWLWYDVEFEPVENLDVRFDNTEMRSPSLVVKENGIWLCIPFEKKVKYHKVRFGRPVLAIDLGVNPFAVCSVVASDGTILGREFIDLPREKDRFWKLAGRIAKKASQTKYLNAGFAKHLWRKLKNISDYIAHVVSKRIAELAEEYGCFALVFERLGKRKVKGNSKGARKLRKKLRLWLYGRIQKYAYYKAKWKGIRTYYVNPKGTSKYAFDGSGEVERFQNAKLAKFTNGKIYNANLSASYNIGARFWIRELTKTLGETQGCSHWAKVPGGNGGPPPVLASLISMVRDGCRKAPFTRPLLYAGQYETATRTLV